MTWSNNPIIKVLLVTRINWSNACSLASTSFYAFALRCVPLANHMSPDTMERIGEASMISLGLHFLWHPLLAYTRHLVGGKAWLYGNTFDLIRIAFRGMKTAVHKSMDTGVYLRIRRRFSSTQPNLIVIGILAWCGWLALDGSTYLSTLLHMNNGRSFTHESAAA